MGLWICIGMVERILDLHFDYQTEFGVNGVFFVKVSVSACFHESVG